jgi:hypothetical protein
MKLTFTQHDQTVTIETASEGQDLAEMCELFKQLLLGAGYSFNGEVVIHEPDSGDSI